MGVGVPFRRAEEEEEETQNAVLYIVDEDIASTRIRRTFWIVYLQLFDVLCAEGSSG